MNKRVIVCVLIASFVLSSMFLGTKALKAQAAKPVNLMEIYGKLEEVIANQKAIIQRLDEQKEELRAIKIRSTLRGSAS